MVGRVLLVAATVCIGAGVLLAYTVGCLGASQILLVAGLLLIVAYLLIGARRRY
jgi:hypothetical protein